VSNDEIYAQLSAILCGDAWEDELGSLCAACLFKDWIAGELNRLKSSIKPDEEKLVAEQHTLAHLSVPGHQQSFYVVNVQFWARPSHGDIPVTVIIKEREP